MKLKLGKHIYELKNIPQAIAKKLQSINLKFGSTIHELKVLSDKSKPQAKKPQTSKPKEEKESVIGSIIGFVIGLAVVIIVFTSVVIPVIQNQANNLNADNTTLYSLSSILPTIVMLGVIIMIFQFALGVSHFR